MILLWGKANDEPLAQVLAALRKCGADLILADQDDTLDVVAVGNRPGGVMAIGGSELDLDAVTAAYLRPQPREVSAFDQVMMAWADAATALIVNRPASMSSNASKPFQLRWIERHGFATPATIITTDANAVRAFKMQHKQIIYKSLSGVRSIVTQLKDDRSLDNVQYCPTQFQEYVPGVDFRVHMIGDLLFTCRVESDADDYRYAHDKPPVLTAFELPDQIGNQIREMVRDMGLSIAGIDLRLTPAGEWFCFEVNPSPGFSYFSNATGQPIATAIAQLLIAGTPVTDRVLGKTDL